MVVEKTPAHCVSVTWSTLGRQPRARGDTHIWNTDAVSLILAAPRSLFIPCVRLRRCDVKCKRALQYRAVERRAVNGLLQITQVVIMAATL